MSESTLPSISWITSVTELLDQYRLVALLVICLAVAITLMRGRKDFGFWLCWTIVGLCALTIIGSDVKKQFTAVGEVGGGTVTQVPNNMFLYSDERDTFYVARLRNGTFPDRNDYEWIRINASGEEKFRHINFMGLP